MTSEEFWEDDPHLFESYGKAYQIRTKEELKKENILAYIKGEYNLLAFAQVMANSFSKTKAEIFPRKPFDMDKENEFEKGREKLEKFKSLQSKWNKHFKEKKGE